MPVSGIECDKEVTESLKEMKEHRKHRYIIYKIRRGTKSYSINISKKGKRDCTFMDFLRDVPKEEPRYIVYNFTYMTKEWEQRDRIMFIFWSPDKSRIEDKVQYSATKSAVLKEINKVLTMKHVELTDLDELKERELIKFGQPLREKENSLVGVQSITIQR